MKLFHQSKSLKFKRGFYETATGTTQKKESNDRWSWIVNVSWKLISVLWRHICRCLKREFKVSTEKSVVKELKPKRMHLENGWTRFNLFLEFVGIFTPGIWNTFNFFRQFFYFENQCIKWNTKKYLLIFFCVLWEPLTTVYS